MQCEMRDTCTGMVTHIGSRGYLYCADHAAMRRRMGREKTRKMRPWELRWVAAGRTLPGYRPGPESKEATS